MTLQEAVLGIETEVPLPAYWESPRAVDTGGVAVESRITYQGEVKPRSQWDDFLEWTKTHQREIAIGAAVLVVMALMKK